MSCSYVDFFIRYLFTSAGFFQTKQFKISFDQTGRLIELLARSSNKNYLQEREAAFL